MTLRNFLSILMCICLIYGNEKGQCRQDPPSATAMPYQDFEFTESYEDYIDLGVNQSEKNSLILFTYGRHCLAIPVGRDLVEPGYKLEGEILLRGMDMKYYCEIVPGSRDKAVWRDIKPDTRTTGPANTDTQPERKDEL